VCDTLCFRTDAGMAFGKSSDRPPGEAQVLLAHVARPAGARLATQYLEIEDPGAFAFVGSHPTWLWGAEHGLNEHGVAVGNELVWTVDDPRAQPRGLLGMDLVRIGLERGRTADDAIDAMTAALAAHGQGGSGEHGQDVPYFSSFLVVDARGGWVLETSGRTWAARPVGTGAAISNRITLTTDWTRASDDVPAGADFDRWRSPSVPTSLADHRLAATRACVARRLPDAAADVAATLRDHGAGAWGSPAALPAAGTSAGSRAESAANPVPAFTDPDNRHITVCMHVRDFQATTASFVAELQPDAPPRAWACLGSPCASVYVPFFPPSVPPVLTDPAQWARFAALRDRVERDASALAEVRTVLAPVEQELWAEADALVAAGDAGPRTGFGRRAGARVDDALTTLGV